MKDAEWRKAGEKVDRLRSRRTIQPSTETCSRLPELSPDRACDESSLISFNLQVFRPYSGVFSGQPQPRTARATRLVACRNGYLYRRTSTAVSHRRLRNLQDRGEKPPPFLSFSRPDRPTYDQSPTFIRLPSSRRIDSVCAPASKTISVSGIHDQITAVTAVFENIHRNQLRPGTWTLTGVPPSDSPRRNLPTWLLTRVSRRHRHPSSRRCTTLHTDPSGPLRPGRVRVFRLATCPVN